MDNQDCRVLSQIMYETFLFHFFVLFLKSTSYIQGYSDWSTQIWPFDDVKDERAVSVRVRVSKLLPGPAQGPSIVMEAAKYLKGDTADSNMNNFFQVRIASLHSGNKPWKMGVFAICPVANNNCSARFHHIKFGDPVSVHGSELNIDS